MDFLDVGPNFDSMAVIDTNVMKRFEHGVYNDIFTFPETKSSERRENIGHCVTIIGYTKVPDLRFRVRNSFGSMWGFDGDFNIKAHHVSPSTIHTLLAIPFDSIIVSKN